MITVDAFREVLRLYPHAGFGAQGARDILCRLCRDKPASTYDNFVSAFGREFGVDGRGAGKEEYTAAWERATGTGVVLGNFAYLEGLLRE